METAVAQSTPPAPQAVSQPKTRNYFSGSEMCRGCKQHKSVCKCALSAWHDINRDLTPRQEKFLRNYIQSTGKMLGNGTLSYADAYAYDLENSSRIKDIDINGKDIPGTSDYEKMENVCRSAASRMLANVNIEPHITRLYLEMWNDQRVDRELMKLVTKGEIAAIKEYNALNKRITKKLDITTNGNSINLTDEQRAKLDALFTKPDEMVQPQTEQVPPVQQGLP